MLARPPVVARGLVASLPHCTPVLGGLSRGLGLGGGTLALLLGQMLPLLLQVGPQVHHVGFFPEPALLQPDVPGWELDRLLGWGQVHGWLGLVRRRQGMGRLPVG